MIELRPCLRRRKDKFEKSVEARQALADLGLDDNGIYLLLVEYGFHSEAELFAGNGGIRIFDSTHFSRIAPAFRLYFASDKYPGVECDPDKLVEDRRWAVGLELCAVIVSCLNEVELERERKIARKFIRILDGRS